MLACNWLICLLLICLIALRFFTCHSDQSKHPRVWRGNELNHVTFSSQMHDIVYERNECHLFTLSHVFFQKQIFSNARNNRQIPSNISNTNWRQIDNKNDQICQTHNAHHSDLLKNCEISKFAANFNLLIYRW